MLFGILSFLVCSCPQVCAQEGCFGAFLLEEKPHIAFQCIQAMRTTLEEEWQNKVNQNQSNSPNTSLPRPRLSCKIRLQETVTQSTTIAQNLVQAGCELLAVHCRRRHQKHDGAPDWAAGKAIVQALSGTTPVILNGGITSIQEVTAVLQETNAHAVMVGMGFLVNPLMLVQPEADPAIVAATYLKYAAEFPPPSPLFLQRHLRWMFRAVLAPETIHPDTVIDFQDWRPRLWTFLVRPYLKTLDQFRQVVALYVKLNGSELPDLLRDMQDPTFRSIRHANHH
jgi:tRNA-dihydrouridine synthase